MIRALGALLFCLIWVLPAAAKMADSVVIFGEGESARGIAFEKGRAFYEGSKAAVSRYIGAGTEVTQLQDGDLSGDVSSAEDPADFIIRGGPIYTGEDADPVASAIAVRDGEIIYVTTVGTGLLYRGRDTRVINLKGAALFPGFTDAHAHLLGIGQRELVLNLEGTASIADLKSRVAAEVEKSAPGQLVYGRGWIETHWPEKRFPNRHDLDPVSGDHPVLLTRADGHALVANSKALALAGITRETPDPEGGQILKGADGEPTGMLIDNAQGLVAKLVSAPTEADLRAAVGKFVDVYGPRGWTGIHAMSVMHKAVPLFEEMGEAGALPLRVYASINPGGAQEFFANGPRAAANERIVTRAIKMYTDGALGSRGAALLESYHDAKGLGLLVTSREEALPLMTWALGSGIQINMHAIGDRGNRLTLDWFAEAFKAMPQTVSPRWRIEHAQVLSLADIPRFAGLGVIASMQPSHAIGDLHFAPARLGLERLKGAYAWKSLIDSGAIIAGGSDAPVEKGDPLIEFYAAVARKDLNGYSGPGWHPEEALTRATALKLFTLWPAYASFQEESLGTIAVGKRADFTAFADDIMTIPEDQIPHTRAVLTIVDGDVVFDAL